MLNKDKDYPDNLAYIFWNVFNNKNISLKGKALTCEQLYALEFIKVAIKHLNMNCNSKILEKKNRKITR